MAAVPVRSLCWVSALVGGLALLLHPLLNATEELELDAVMEWGLQGPGKDLPLPLMGVRRRDVCVGDVYYWPTLTCRLR